MLNHRSIGGALKSCDSYCQIYLIFMFMFFNKLQALLAQSVARVTLNHKVRGSSPLQGLIFLISLHNC